MENTEQNNQNQEDWFKAAMIFAKALGLILDEDQGIIADLNETTKIPGFEDINKVIVFRKDNQVHIAPCDQDIEEGNTVILDKDDSIDSIQN